MIVNEIFYSISGEGGSAGRPAVFIRLAGCNFIEEKHPCYYCDTVYAGRNNAGKKMTIEEVFRTIKTSWEPVFGIYRPLIIITGGEPLLNEKDVINLVSVFSVAGHDIEIETNGSYQLSNMLTSLPVNWSLDIKTPSSGNSNMNVYENLDKLGINDQVKFVCGNIKDLEFAEDIILKYPTSANLFIQPSYGVTDMVELINFIKMRLPMTRLSTQIHKLYFGKEARGV